MNHLDSLHKQVREHDLMRIFDGLGRYPDANRLLEECCKRAKDLFGPLAINLEEATSWVAHIWDQGEGYGYVFAETNGALTAARCPRMLQRFNYRDQPTYDAFKWLYTNRSGHWNISRAGDGIKSILGIAGWTNGTDYASCEKTVNEAIATITGFDGSDCQVFWDNTTSTQKWNTTLDLSIPFHLVWPQFFPAHYKETNWGYSQIKGMQQLLCDLAIKLQLKLRTLNLHDYGDYSAAYRLLLTLYDAFVYEDEGAPRQTPHFDFLTQLLAERPDVEGEQLLLMKQSLVIYGIPGTSKTHFAQQELLAPPLFEEKDKVYRVQFHAGYSYADFLIGIRPRTTKGEISYEVEPGRLYRLAAEAANALKGVNSFGDGMPRWESTADDEQGDRDMRQPLRYALLIDEINRADLARVFGEVLYCIEYRHEPIALPHCRTAPTLSVFSGKPISDPFEGGAKFYLPKNLYIVGTMNQADRSIGAFDAAMRRRFAWYKLDFSTARLLQMLEEKGRGSLSKSDQFNALLPRFVARASRLNQLIEEGRCEDSHDEGKKQAIPLSAEHRIGHTWFAEVVGIMQSLGHDQGEINTLHLDRLWLYFLNPQLEDALGFEAISYGAELERLREFFTQRL